MAEFENRNHVKPPLGELRDFSKEESERLLALDFETVDSYPELKTTATIVNEELNVYREKFGLDALPIEEDAVRLVDEQTYDSERYAQKEDESGAFFHSINRKIFVRFDRTKYSSGTFEKMHKVYAVAHEFAHRAMEKGGLISGKSPTYKRLTEGFADWLTKDILNRRVLASVTSAENLQSRAGYIQDMRPEKDGFQLKEDEIIPTAPEENQFSFSRIPEIRLIEHIQTRKPEIFQGLLKATFEGDIETAGKLLEQAFGSEMRDKLGDSNVPTRELLAEMTEQK